MSRVFADAQYWVAILNGKDQSHASARAATQARRIRRLPVLQDRGAAASCTAPQDEHRPGNIRSMVRMPSGASCACARRAEAADFPRILGAPVMRMPRMTTRRLMVAVAILATLLGGALEAKRLWLLRRYYLELAVGHACWCDYLRIPEAVPYWEARWTAQREGVKGSYPWPDKPPFVPAMAAYHARMRAKWEQAAARPWLPVEPDPDLRNPPRRPGSR